VTQKQFEQYVAEWQTRLGLERWQLTHSWEKPLVRGANAVITRSSSYDTASLRVARDWQSWPADKLAWNVVHELLHLHMRDVDQTVAPVKDALHPDAWAMFNARYEHEIEGVIDRLAARIVEIAA
jgi:hypothetical protein